MYWQRVANNKIQKVLPFRVYPLNKPKPDNKNIQDHNNYGFFMENYTELNKNDDKKQRKDAK